MPNLKNDKPIDPLDEANAPWLRNLQGNILNGHGRDHTVHLFLRLPGDATRARDLVKELSALVTSAHKQEIERLQFKKYGIPGRLFGNLFLSANGYRKLGFPPAYSSLRHRFAGRQLQGGGGWTRLQGWAWARRSAPATPAETGPRPSRGGGCRRAASKRRCFACCGARTWSWSHASWA